MVYAMNFIPDFILFRFLLTVEYLVNSLFIAQSTMRYITNAHSFLVNYLPFAHPIACFITF